MDISARTDYAIRAMLVLAEAQRRDGGQMSAEEVANGQGLPKRFLDAILADLRRGGLVTSARGAAGGYSLARPATEITLGDIFRTVDGPLAEVHGLRPHETAYLGPAASLPTVWVAVRASLRRVLDEVTLAALIDGRLPRHVRRLAEAPDAWTNR
ncbi:MAG: RrF2 family transcriptional regulator [Dermatophilaceae bacterium]